MRSGLLASLLLLAACSRDAQPDPEYAAACHGPPIRSVEQRQEAMERGYAINERHDCIDKNSFAEVQRQEAAREQALAERVSGRRIKVDRSLAAERAGFVTEISVPPTGLPMPQPPPDSFRRHDYDEARGLAAFVTPDPGDAGRHPAILWITGGDCNSLGEFWVDGPPENDQSASAYRKAGVVLMFATLRGGNGSLANREVFFGEVDDVRAAGEYLAKLPYVDPARVYLGGHSTGGTLALLVAEAGGPFAGVFAFGPVRSISTYPTGLVHADFATLPARELKLRSPVHWLEAIEVPTYLIEGMDAPGNFRDLEELCALTRNPAVHCVPVAGHDHFSVLNTVNRVLAARIAVGHDAAEALIKAAQFAR
jgi:hypothetical protein